MKASPAAMRDSSDDVSSIRNVARAVQPWKRPEASPLKMRKIRANQAQTACHSSNNFYAPGSSQYMSPDERLLNNENRPPALHQRTTCGKVSVTDMLTEPSTSHVRSSLELQRTCIDPSAVADAYSRPSTAMGTFVKVEEKLFGPGLRGRSVRQRVMSRVKDGLLSRSRSTSKFLAKPDARSHAQKSDDHGARSQTGLEISDTTDSRASHLSTTYNSPIGRTTFADCSSVATPRKPNHQPHSTPHPMPSRQTFSHPSRRSSGDLALCTPLIAKLNITPETIWLEASETKVLRVMIEVQGANTPNRERQPDTNEYSAQTQPIDLVVICDNSPLATPRSLQSMCTIVDHIGHSLRDPGDRLAVFSTLCRHDVDKQSSMSGCQLHALSPPCAVTLAAALATIGSPSNQDPCHTEHSRFPEGLVRELSSADTTPKNPQILVISPRPDCLSQRLGQLTTWPIHHMRVGFFKVTTSDVAQKPGEWRIDAEDEPLDNSKGIHGCMGTIENMLDQLRTGHDPGLVTDLTISCNAARHCRILEFTGDCKIPVLGPGERHCLSLKMLISGSQQESSPRQKRLRHERSFQDICNDLEYMLGNSLTEILTVDVRYKHSIFPSDTFLSMQKSCKVRRFRPGSIWTLPDQGKVEHPDHVELAQSRLATYIARKNAPRHALDLFASHFEKGELDLSGDRVSAMYQEVRYQAHLEKPVRRQSSLPKQSDMKTAIHISQQSLFRTAPSSPYQHPSCKDLESRQCSTSASDIMRDVEGLESTAEPDAAREIWHRLRRTSRVSDEQAYNNSN